jgi:hypothetical protein
VHVSIRPTSIIPSVRTTEMLDGSIRPCRFKLATAPHPRSGDTSRLAGTRPRSTGPASRRPVPAPMAHSFPLGIPCPVVM